MAVGRLFKSNVARFRSLSCIKLFKHALEENGDVIENFKLLIEAITAIKESFTLYEANDKVGNHKNYHGMALCEFQLGYIYHMYAEKLGSTQLCSRLDIEEFSEYFLGSVSNCHLTAYNKYESAF